MPFWFFRAESLSLGISKLSEIRPNVMISKSENFGFGPGFGIFPASLTSFSKSVWIIGKTLSKLPFKKTSQIYEKNMRARLGRLHIFYY